MGSHYSRFVVHEDVQQRLTSVLSKIRRKPALRARSRSNGSHARVSHVSEAAVIAARSDAATTAAKARPCSKSCFCCSSTAATRSSPITPMRSLQKKEGAHTQLTGASKDPSTTVDTRPAVGVGAGVGAGVGVGAAAVGRVGSPPPFPPNTGGSSAPVDHSGIADGDIDLEGDASGDESSLEDPIDDADAPEEDVDPEVFAEQEFVNDLYMPTYYQLYSSPTLSDTVMAALRTQRSGALNPSVHKAKRAFLRRLKGKRAYPKAKKEGVAEAPLAAAAAAVGESKAAPAEAGDQLHAADRAVREAMQDVAGEEKAGDLADEAEYDDDYDDDDDNDDDEFEGARGVSDHHFREMRSIALATSLASVATPTRELSPRDRSHADPPSPPAVTGARDSSTVNAAAPSLSAPAALPPIVIHARDRQPLEDAPPSDGAPAAV